MTQNFRRILERLEEQGHTEFAYQVEELGKLHKTLFALTNANVEVQEAVNNNILDMISTINENNMLLNEKLDTFMEHERYENHMQISAMRDMMEVVVQHNRHNRHERDAEDPFEEEPYEPAYVNLFSYCFK